VVTSTTASTSTTTTTLGPNHAPRCAGAVASPALLWPPDHKFVDVDVHGVTDPDGDRVTVTVTAIRQDELPTLLGPGKNCPDADGVGTTHARVRAERDGPGDGRVYHLSVRATDARGASCTATVRVCVPHDKGHKGDCVDEGPLFASTGPCLRIPPTPPDPPGRGKAGKKPKGHPKP
jgi:hypothetical protein